MIPRPERGWPTGAPRVYGMIHRAIREMVIAEAGDTAWAALEREFGAGPADMISAMVYPDERTVALLGAAAERLGQALPECLRRFGHHWVRFAGSGAYAGIMDFVSRDFAGFIAHLDRMHQAVCVAMPEARVPEFTLLADDGTTVRVGYRSGRTGLEPFVAGLLEGLLERFGHTGSVTRAGEGPAGHEFVVTFEPAAGR